MTGNFRTCSILLKKFFPKEPRFPYTQILIWPRRKSLDVTGALPGGHVKSPAIPLSINCRNTWHMLESIWYEISRVIYKSVRQPGVSLWHSLQINACPEMLSSDFLAVSENGSRKKRQDDKLLLHSFCSIQNKTVRVRITINTPMTFEILIA